MTTIVHHVLPSWHEYAVVVASNMAMSPAQDPSLLGTPDSALSEADPSQSTLQQPVNAESHANNPTPYQQTDLFNLFRPDPNALESHMIYAI